MRHNLNAKINAWKVQAAGEQQGFFMMIPCKLQEQDNVKEELIAEDFFKLRQSRTLLNPFFYGQGNEFVSGLITDLVSASSLKLVFLLASPSSERLALKPTTIL